MLRLRLSSHMVEVMSERHIEPQWVQRAIEAPDWVDTDPNDPQLVRAFMPIPERGGRILRVVYRPDGEMMFVVTAFFDRGARRR